jgi:hypothetical protein
MKPVLYSSPGHIQKNYRSIPLINIDVKIPNKIIAN